MNILEKIEKLELILPPAPKPLGIYKPTLIIDNFLYVSGQGPVKSDGSLIIGKVGLETKSLTPKEVQKFFIKVAIDSEASAGGGSQAKLISKHYNLFYLDTGKIIGIAFVGVVAAAMIAA